MIKSLSEQARKSIIPTITDLSEWREYYNLPNRADFNYQPHQTLSQIVFLCLFNDNFIKSEYGGGLHNPRIKSKIPSLSVFSEPQQTIF